MSTRVADIETASNRLREQITRQDWTATGAALNEIAGLAVDALLQVDEDAIVGVNEASVSLYGALVAGFRVKPATGAQGLADQFVGISRLVEAALRKRRTVTLREADFITNHLTKRILLALRDANHPLSNIDLASRVNCRQETIARRMPQLRQARLVKSWPAGRSMFNTITQDGLDLLAGRDAGRTPNLDGLRELVREPSRNDPTAPGPNFIVARDRVSDTPDHFGPRVREVMGNPDQAQRPAASLSPNIRRFMVDSLKATASQASSGFGAPLTRIPLERNLNSSPGPHSVNADAPFAG